MDRRRRVVLTALATTGVIGTAGLALGAVPEPAGTPTATVGAVSPLTTPRELSALRADLAISDAAAASLAKELTAARRAVADGRRAAAAAEQRRVAQALAAEQAQARAAAVAAAASAPAPVTHTSTGASGGGRSGERDDAGESEGHDD